MAFDVEIREGLAQVIFRGQVTCEDLRQLANVAAEIELEAQIAPDRIVDFTEAEALDLDFSAMQAFADMRQQSKLRNPVRSALVAPQSLQYGFARMYQSLNQHSAIDVQIFTSREEAMAWIGEGRRL